LNFMIVLNKKEVQQNAELIPDTKGIYYFSDKEKHLFFGITSDLRRRVKFLLSHTKDDKVVFQMISLSETISFIETETLLEALQEEKLVQPLPEFNNRIKFHKDYYYLGINFHKVPYFRICENTQDELFYIGPFRGRFFVYDFLQIMNELFAFPACEGEEFPCELYKNKLCKGWCVGETKELQKILDESYLNRNTKLLTELEKKQKELYNNLDFTESDNLMQKINVIKKYYKNLDFLKNIKTINTEFEFKNVRYFIKNGMLIKTVTNEQTEYFTEDLTEFRENEKYAINKGRLNEMWIIYQHLVSIEKVSL
jgi:excinuclease UvrABC nuclease subunit